MTATIPPQTSAAARQAITRTLSESDRAARLAHKVLDRINADPDDDLAVLARQLLRSRERFEPRSMDSAPRDGTHILAYMFRERDDENRAFGEWREIFYKPYEAIKGWNTPWHAGDPFDSHTHGEAPEHFGEAVPVAWVPLPDRPKTI